MNYSKETEQLLILGPDILPLEDYSALGLSADHASELTRMATDPKFLRAKENSPKFLGAVHAWYALGQFKALNAISPLLDLIPKYPYDLLFDQDLLKVFESMGSGVILEFRNYLQNTSKPNSSKDMILSYLGKIGKNYRQECLEVLNEFLLTADSNNIESNSFAVCSLMDLKAVESIDIIRQAFLQNRIEIRIPGDIEDVEIDLGLREKRDTPKPNYNLGLFDFEGEEDYASKTVRLPAKIGRNDPCPCDSGKKYKKCCLQ
jgi:hypothetical protein